MLYGKPLITASLVFSLVSFNTQATLTSQTVNGQNVVYDSGNNTTWTQDANLLGTMEASEISKNGNDTSLINNIINASGGVIHDTPNVADSPVNSGTHPLTGADFGTGGLVDWWGAQAFAHYLNAQHYAGISQWALPTSPDQNFGYNITNSQFGELYYNELQATAYPAANYGIFGNAAGTDTSGSVGPFINAHTWAYWSGTEYAPTIGYAMYFNDRIGLQNASGKSILVQNYAWAVSPGQVTTVPVPGAVWLFGTGLLGLLGLRCRK